MFVVFLVCARWPPRYPRQGVIVVKAEKNGLVSGSSINLDPGALAIYLPLKAELEASHWVMKNCRLGRKK